MIKASFFESVVNKLVEVDPRQGNALKTGFEIDISGTIPQSLKSILYDCLMARKWTPVKGLTLSSTKPVFPVYQGVTRSGWIHFKFPADLILNVSEILIVRHIDVRMTDLYIQKDLSRAKLAIALWPDIEIKL
jgi:hypothetical protein